MQQKRNILDPHILKDCSSAVKNVTFISLILLFLIVGWVGLSASGHVGNNLDNHNMYDLGAFVEPNGYLWMSTENLGRFNNLLGTKVSKNYSRYGFIPLTPVMADLGGFISVSGQSAQIRYKNKVIFLRVKQIPNLPMMVQFGDKGINVYLSGNTVPRLFPITTGGVAIPKPYVTWADPIYNLLLGDGWNPKGDAKKILISALENPSPVQVVLPSQKKENGKMVSNVFSVPDELKSPGGLPKTQNLIGVVAKLKPNAGNEFDPFEFHSKPIGVRYLLTDKQLKYIPAVTPDEIKYRPINNPDAVIGWLAAKNSLLANKQYLNILDSAGQRFNIHPLLLLAVTGQEQSFVPAGSQGASEMVKNPFNVYGSWQIYAPGFDKSAAIAAQTLNRLSANCPPGTNPIQWIDSPSNPRYRYAEDTGWWKGVSIFFNQLIQIDK